MKEMQILGIDFVTFFIGLTIFCTFVVGFVHRYCCKAGKKQSRSHP